MAAQASVVYAEPTNKPPHGSCATSRREAPSGWSTSLTGGEAGLGVPQLPAGARRGRPQRRGVRRGRASTSTSRSAGSPDDVAACPVQLRDEGDRPSGYRPRTPDLALLADGAHQRHPPAALGQPRRRRHRGARLPVRALLGGRRLSSACRVAGWTSVMVVMLIGIGADPVLPRRRRRVRRCRGQHGDGQAALPDHRGQGDGRWAVTRLSRAVTPPGSSARACWAAPWSAALRSWATRCSPESRGPTRARPVARAARRRRERRGGGPGLAWCAGAGCRRHLRGAARGGGARLRAVPRRAGSRLGPGGVALPRVVGRWRVRRLERSRRSPRPPRRRARAVRAGEAARWSARRRLRRAHRDRSWSAGSPTSTGPGRTSPSRRGWSPCCAGPSSPGSRSASTSRWTRCATTCSSATPRRWSSPGSTRSPSGRAVVHQDARQRALGTSVGGAGRRGHRVFRREPPIVFRASAFSAAARCETCVSVGRLARRSSTPRWPYAAGGPVWPPRATEHRPGAALPSVQRFYAMRVPGHRRRRLHRQPLRAHPARRRLGR